jgi:hypothetical protein
MLGRLEIAVPSFFQQDPRWSDERLGTSLCDTLGSAGCAVSSAAMVLAFYGVTIDPQLLNQHLIAHHGYEGDSWIKWEIAATYPPEAAQHIYEDLPSYGLIDCNLLLHNPVIVRIRRPTGKTHFVVIVGKKGFHYLIRDPAPQGMQGVYPLSQLAVPIEALRFYCKKKLPVEKNSVLNVKNQLTNITIMSLAAINTATKPNINHLQNQPLQPAPHQKEQPTVEDSKGRLTPTDTERAVQDTGNQTVLQQQDVAANLSNPLVSQQFNSQIAANRL